MSNPCFSGLWGATLWNKLEFQNRKGKLDILHPVITTAMKGSYDWGISSFGNHLASQKAEVKLKIKAYWQSHSKAPVRSSGMGQRFPVILWNVLQPGLLGTAPSSYPGCHMSWPLNSSFGGYKWGYTFFFNSILCFVSQIKAINLNFQYNHYRDFPPKNYK